MFWYLWLLIGMFIGATLAVFAISFTLITRVKTYQVTNPISSLPPRSEYIE